MKTMYRLFAIITLISLAICLPTFTALAAPTSGQPAGYSGIWSELSADGSAISYRNGQAYVYLAQDINLSTDITVAPGQTLNFHLNDKVLTGSGKGSIFTVESGGTLNIYDVDPAIEGTERISILGYGVYNANQAPGGEYAQDIAIPTFTFKGGYITGGYAQNGGAVYIAGGEVNLHNGVFLNNKAAQNGGAIYVGSGTLNLWSGTISHNIAPNGGVYLGQDGFINANGIAEIISNYQSLNINDSEYTNIILTPYSDSNLYLSDGKTINTNGDSTISITTEKKPTAPIIIATSNIANHYLRVDNNANQGELVFDAATNTISLHPPKTELMPDGSAIKYERYSIPNTDPAFNHADDGRDIATIYLNRDIILTQDIVVKDNQTLYLNLNQFLLTGTGTGSVITVEEGGKLVVDAFIGTNNHSRHYDPLTDKIYTGFSPIAEYEFGGGAITGGHASYGGGIYVAGELIMKNGTIIDNTADIAGGGVYIAPTGSFSIDDNEIDDEHGNPIAHPANARIIGNTVAGKANNLYLPQSQTIKILGELNTDSYALRGTYIGITPENPPNLNTNLPITTDASKANLGNTELLANFYVDNGHDILIVEANEIALQAPRPTTIIPSGYRGAWQILEEDNSLANGDNYYFLNEDISLSRDIIVENGQILHLHLNDYSLSGTGTGSVITVESGGTLYIYSSTARKGLITGGHAQYGGGLNIEAGGTATLYGGTIEGNMAEFGGGVYVDEAGTLNVAGNPRIFGNSQAGTDQANNLYLPTGQSITMQSGTGGSAKIGVTTEDAPLTATPITIASGADSITKHALAYFTSDNLAYGIDIATAGQVNLTTTPPQTMPADAIQPENGLIGGEQWQELDAAGGTLDSGYYFLANDLTLTTDLIIPSGATVYLHLNDKILTGSGADSVITVEFLVTFYLYDVINGSPGHWDTATESIQAGQGDAVDYPFSGGVITGGNTSENGGGISITSSNKSAIYGGNIVGNHADGLGGGLSVWGSDNFVVKGGSFIANSANNNGGGISLFASHGSTVENVDILGNISKNHGGGVQIFGNDVNIRHTTIANNNSSIFGGAIFTTGNSSIHLEYVDIDANRAMDGGGLFVSDQSNAVIEHSSFTNNYAQYLGGAISSRQDIIVVDTIISGNSADIGGGINIYRPTITGTVRTYLEDCTITDNTAQEMGGGLLFSGGFHHNNLMRLFNMRGKMIISNNKLADGSENDLLLTLNNVFHVYGKPEPGTLIGVYSPITPVNDGKFIVTESDASLVDYLYTNNKQGNFSYQNGIIIMTEYIPPISGGGGGSGGSATRPTDEITVERIENADGTTDVKISILLPIVTTSDGSSHISLADDTAQRALEYVEGAPNHRYHLIIAGQEAANANHILTMLTVAKLNQLAQSGIESLIIEGSLGNINFNSEALAAIALAAKQSGANDADLVQIVIEKIADNTTGLTTEQLALAGTLPVYNLYIELNGKRITDFGLGSATITLYGVSPQVYVYFIDAEANLAAMQGAYDSQNNAQIFVAKHFSRYMLSEELIPAALPFSDVVSEDWFYSAVQHVFQTGQMLGTADDLFSPNLGSTRAMIVTILHRAEGSPKAAYSPLFNDVAAKKWYSEPIIWAANHDLVGGYGNGQFGVNDHITREQLAAILYRHAAPASEASDEVLAKFSDTEAISDWALEALKWAVAEGIITGKTADILDPKGTATRAELATMLMRYFD